MRALGKLLAIVIAAGALAQEPPPPPGHGPYAKPGWHCYRGETQESKKLAHCSCQLHCDDQGEPHEANDCATYCAKPSPCLCHSDELCEAR